MTDVAMLPEQRSQYYELLYIVPVHYTIDELPSIVEKIKATLTEFGAQIAFEDDLGKRKLAYAIKKAYHGYYRTIEFSLDPDKLTKLTTTLGLLTEISRHLIVTTVERTADERAALKQRQRAAEEHVAQIESAPVVEPGSKPTPKPEVDQAALDRKLDEIIDETII